MNADNHHSNIPLFFVLTKSQHQMSISTSQIVINFGNYHHMIYKVTYFITFRTPESVKKTKILHILELRENNQHLTPEHAHIFIVD